MDNRRKLFEDRLEKLAQCPEGHDVRHYYSLLDEIEKLKSDEIADRLFIRDNTFDIVLGILRESKDKESSEELAIKITNKVLSGMGITNLAR